MNKCIFCYVHLRELAGLKGYTPTLDDNIKTAVFVVNGYSVCGQYEHIAKAQHMRVGDGLLPGEE